jgi:DNA polymerase-3 subunit gamma/tau
VDTRFLYGALRLMNKCDLSYRQSSNKRLLVELTLIEVAQLTQPDDGSAGRQPRRLKSLFKHLMDAATKPKAAKPSTQPEMKPAPQVAAAAQEKETGATAREKVAVQQPKLRLSGITTSWNNLRKQDEQKKMSILPGTPGVSADQQQEKREFTQADLELQWMAMCNRMPQELSGIATRMKNMNPTITELPQIEVQVDNALIKQEMEDFKGRIVSSLRNGLQNESLSLEIVIVEQKEQVKVMTRREQFEKLTKENPAIDKLRQVFNLELA